LIDPATYLRRKDDMAVIIKQLMDDTRRQAQLLLATRRILEDRRTEFDALVQRVCTGDWCERLTAEAQSEELERMARPLATAEHGAEQAARAALALADRALLLAEADPMLAGEDLVRANSLREFVKEDVERWSSGAIPENVRHATARGDRAEVWLVSRYLRQRVDREIEQAIEVQVLRGKAGPILSDREIEEALAKCDEFLADPALEGVREQARELRRKARDTANLAGARHREAQMQELIRGQRPPGTRGQQAPEKLST
jgi:hypothetical protein